MNYLSIKDIDSLENWVKEARDLKQDPLKYKQLGSDKTIGLLFFNPSLRTRLSTQKAAQQLGMNCMVMNFDKEGWALEYGNGIIMDQGKSEHVKEAAQVISQFCDIIAIRAFAGLEDKELDKAEVVLSGFVKYASVPIVNMESSVGHPLQALADAITLEEDSVRIKNKKPKVVLSWAPHPKALPHAVANSFIEMMQRQDAEFVITHPEGYELDPEIVGESTVEYDQNKAFKGADYIYTKNWSSFREYGKVTSKDASWTISEEKMALTNKGRFMHCLPVRRNVVVNDEVLESGHSLVIQQADNRTYAAQIVLKKILETL
ncbi:N-acetylornithine carbamoyltransferase [Lutimonas zeaxanthinifaciens]|uniref:N-acetylornithine carbamoyltransferase n=1 Tax=Lutimonas zeaxanthinifaciens TaxID=3060215 RepID=UPI00265CD192|nr:N-acetylornithine carbamoyltransferase [Lutimonas sp. YSD2104]WKK65517.1 N-acetylornithine carbamoyltransferase [Lutimonas sp. YSD2104]